MLQQRIQAERAEPFPGDDGANQAVLDQRRRVADFATATKHLATHQFRRPEDRDSFRQDVIRMRDDIVSRATSAGIAPHEMGFFWEAALSAAQAKYRCCDIYLIASRHALPPAPSAPLVPPAKLTKLRKIRGGRA